MTSLKNSIPTLPGCVTFGKNLSEAKKMTKDAIKAYMKSLEKHGETVPLFQST